LQPSGARPVYREGDLREKSSEDLIALFSSENRLVRRRASLELGWRGDKSVIPSLIELVDQGSGQDSLEALWSLNLLGGLSDALASKWLTHPQQDIRRWIVRLLGDRRSAPESLGTALADLAISETDVAATVPTKTTSANASAAKA
ncbi:MAG TPA: hypothetical protein PLN52_03175, partial [Opitutaceae bacterium]|nr:hypothetical protein [Opitutaceae bacterium]